MYQGSCHARPVFSFCRQSASLWRFVYDGLRKSRQRGPEPGRTAQWPRRSNPGGSPQGSPPKASTGAVATGNGINYHNGPVLHTVNVYYIWYGDWNGLDPTGPPILTDFVSNEGGSRYFAINTTYGDTTGDVPNAVTFAGQTTVAGNSTSLADNDIANIVATALVQFGGTPDTNGVYFVLTAPGINETSGFLTKYCGWHTNGSVTSGGTTWDIKYAFVGNASGPSLGNCADQTSNSPNGDPGADAMVSVIAHELEETATAPSRYGSRRPWLEPLPAASRLRTMLERRRSRFPGAAARRSRFRRPV